MVLEIDSIHGFGVTLAKLSSQVIFFIAIVQETVEVVKPNLWPKTLADTNLVKNLVKSTVFNCRSPVLFYFRLVLIKKLSYLRL